MEDVVHRLGNAFVLHRHIPFRLLGVLPLQTEDDVPVLRKLLGAEHAVGHALKLYHVQQLVPPLFAVGAGHLQYHIVVIGVKQHPHSLSF